ncbi:hypothetical protein EYF80_024980 [Liparis tanakae]|uniref:Uncharacterized protein n=1 Tax=Liparis tanakae TaxID=230148 RepID=A0A4Z2HHP4_9TELE|nr:hypothetical protein EYF80_024980 [Liparis tanakae]
MQCLLGCARSIARAAQRLARLRYRTIRYTAVFFGPDLNRSRPLDSPEASSTAVGTIRQRGEETRPDGNGAAEMTYATLHFSRDHSSIKTVGQHLTGTWLAGPHDGQLHSETDSAVKSPSSPVSTPTDRDGPRVAGLVGRSGVT